MPSRGGILIYISYTLAKYCICFKLLRDKLKYYFSPLVGSYEIKSCIVGCL